MLNVELNGTEPEHVERIAPKMSVDAQGNISWVPSLLDHNAKVFHRGKTVTNEEFNELFLQQVYRGNYLTDSLNLFFNKHLSGAINSKFRNDFKLVPSYIKTFTSVDWGNAAEDGYYYISIPATEHGFEINTDEEALDRVNIDIEMYLLDTNGMFYEVTQAHIDTNNTVQMYTDDPTIPGFIVIRANEKSYALVDIRIDVNQVDNIADVAKTGSYNDLVDIDAADGPNTRIKQNTDDIIAILTGKNKDEDIVAVAQAIKAVDAEYAKTVTDTINNIPLENIFEDNATSYIVKEARTAYDYKENGAIAEKFNALQDGTFIVGQAQYASYASSDQSKGTIEERLTALGFNEGDAERFEDDRVALTWFHFVQEGNSTFIDISVNLKQTLQSLQLLGVTEVVIGKLPDNFDTTRLYMPTTLVNISKTNEVTGASINFTIKIKNDKTIVYTIGAYDYYGNKANININAKNYAGLKLYCLKSPNKYMLNNYTESEYIWQ